MEKTHEIIQQRLQELQNIRDDYTRNMEQAKQSENKSVYDIFYHARSCVLARQLELMALLDKLTETEV